MVYLGQGTVTEKRLTAITGDTHTHTHAHTHARTHTHSAVKSSLVNPS